MTICSILLILILSSILFSLILHALQEHKNKRKMQADLDFFQQKVKEANIKEEFGKAEKRAIENKVVFLDKQIVKLKQQLKNARENVKRRKKQIQELKD